MPKYQSEALDPKDILQDCWICSLELGEKINSYGTSLIYHILFLWGTMSKSLPEAQGPAFIWTEHCSVLLCAHHCQATGTGKNTSEKKDCKGLIDKGRKAFHAEGQF